MAWTPSSQKQMLEQSRCCPLKMSVVEGPERVLCAWGPWGATGQGPPAASLQQRRAGWQQRPQALQRQESCLDLSTQARKRVRLGTFDQAPAEQSRLNAQRDARSPPAGARNQFIKQRRLLLAQAGHRLG